MGRKAGGSKKSHRRRIFAGDGSHVDQTLPASPRWVEVLEAELARPAAHTPVGELMEREVLCVKSDLSVESLALLFVERSVTGAPVVDDEARLVGFVSLAEIVRDSLESGDTQEVERPKVRIRGGGEYELGEGFHAEEIAHNTVGAIMTPAVVTITKSEPLARAAALMAFEGVRRIPVVDEENRVVGLITSLDVIGWLASRSGYLVPEHHSSWHRPHPNG